MSFTCCFRVSPDSGVSANLGREVPSTTVHTTWSSQLCGRVQIDRGHAVPVRRPVDTAVVLQVELLQAGGTSAWTCGPGPLPRVCSARADPDDTSSPVQPGRFPRSSCTGLAFLFL